MISDLVSRLEPSVTLALAAKAKELKDQGLDVISLTVGEPDWPTYPHIVEAGVEALRSGRTRYTPASGIPELRREIAASTSRQLGIEYKASQVTVTAGAKFTIFAALQSLLNPGDGILIPVPYWLSYTAMADLCRARAQLIETDHTTHFKINGRMLREAITPESKVLLLNSPNNPTGIAYTESELRELAEVLRDHPHIAVVSDDIYNLLVWDQDLAPHILHVAPDLKDRVLSINGASKAYAMTGWRMGWAVGPEPLIAAMGAYTSQTLGCPPSISQYATLAALTGSDESLKQTRQSLRIRKELGKKLVQDVSGLKLAEPDGAFYLWMDVTAFLGKKSSDRVIQDSRDFCQALLEEERVVVVPGQEFGVDGFMRASFALSEKDLTEAFVRIQRFCGKISG